MNCEWVKANITLYVYDELGDDARYELEQHVGRCGACSAELKGMQQFHGAMSLPPKLEPSPNLLAASRMRLQEALETAEQHRGWRLLDPAAWLRQARFSPALASALLIIGFAAGTLTAYRIATTTSGRTAGIVGPASEASISGIRSINQVPGTNNLEIQYDTVVPQKVEGSLTDQRIQQLLLYAARNNNSGVRVSSVEALSKKPEDSRIRESLKASLLYDPNPGVRLKALETLGPYVAEDISVRDAVLEALQNDSNPGVRTEAIHLLQPVRADSTVRAVLQQLAEKDRNDYIRRQSRRVLATLPEID